MNKIIDSKAASWIVLILIILILILTFSSHLAWWTYIDIFCAFMMAFFHLMAVYLKKAVAISRTLDLWALMFCIMAIVAFIVEYIILHITV